MPMAITPSVMIADRIFGKIRVFSRNLFIVPALS
jgi:hypothetical protein